MPRRTRHRRPPSAFDAFFDELIDSVVARAEDIITPALEDISGRVAAMVEDQVRLQGQGQAPGPRPKAQKRPRTGPKGQGDVRCTLCGALARECRCRGQAPPHPPHSPIPRREPTLYDVLEVSPRASVETIEAAYKSLAKRYHPDRNPDPAAEERMKKITAAWDVLQKPLERAAYDRRVGL